MNDFNHEFTSMALHKSRHDELVEQAENQRRVDDARKPQAPRLRRIIRINNNEARR